MKAGGAMTVQMAAAGSPPTHATDRFADTLLTRQVRGQGLYWHRALCVGHRRHQRGDCGGGFEYFERQVKLFDLSVPLICRSPECESPHRSPEPPRL